VERRSRLEREARLLASLSHPNVASLFGIEEFEGTPVLVMELVPGETLAERLERGALSVREALDVARQVAEGLEAAHRRGIIHRDLKPANVKLTPDGRVKVLDFGLAKAFGTAPAADPQQAETASRGDTSSGVVLGTTAYMSPEQARGEELDERTDVWSFGCLLYECVTGRKAFSGSTASDTLAAVLEHTPDWRVLPSTTPALVRSMLRLCLQKDRARRLQSITDVKLELEDAGSAREEPAASASTPLRTIRGRWFFLGAGLAIAALSPIWQRAWVGWSSPARSSPVRLSVGEPIPLTLYGEGALAWSPDGRQLVYAAPRGGSRRLFLRSLDRTEIVEIPGTEGGASGPFFSPDGKWVGFFAAAKLKKVSLSGGAPITVANATEPRGGTWGPDDAIYYCPTIDAGLMRVPASGGTPQRVTSPDAGRQERSHRWPEILPGGKAVLLTVADSQMLSFDDARIVAVSLETGKITELIKGGSYPKFVAPDRLLYARSGIVVGVPFDPARLVVTGPATTVLTDVVTNPLSGGAHFSASDSGSLALIPGGPSFLKSTLAWVDRQGRAADVGLPPAAYQALRISPDGKSVALDIDGANASIWIHELGRGGMTRLTLEWSNNNPAWTPDGAKVVFTSGRGGARNVYWQPIDGSSGATPLTSSKHDQRFPSWSPDGRVLLFQQHNPRGGSDLWILDRERESPPRPFLESSLNDSFNELVGRFSPDGRFIAYASDETGALEIYVRPYPGPGQKRRVSTEGGSFPVWSLSGEELFYRQDYALMSVRVSTRGSFTADPPRMLFRYAAPVPSLRSFDVSADGQKFLMISGVPENSRSASVEVVLDWEAGRAAAARPR
jgi:serine/threonine-protein kinase